MCHVLTLVQDLNKEIWEYMVGYQQSNNVSDIVPLNKGIIQDYEVAAWYVDW